MRGLGARMTLTAVAAAAAALLSVILIVTPRLRQRALADAQESLLSQARLVAKLVQPALARGASVDEVDGLVDAASRSLRARVTVVGPDGRVLGDSAVTGPALLALESHAARPEVRQALDSGTGSAVRRSTTVHEDLLYVAVSVDPIRRLGVARVALSLRGVEEQVAQLRRAVAFALALALLIAIVVSAAASASLVGPLEDMMALARRFAAGDLAARIRVRRTDELGELARILNQSADQLQQRLTEIARDRARMDAILHAMEDGVLAVDHRGNVLLANPTLRRSFQLDDPKGRHYVEVIRQREVGQLIEDVLRRGDRRDLEVELRHLRRVYAITGVPFPGDEGVPHGAVLTFHDATERLRLDQVRRDFVANASHELRTPLTSIRGFVEALEDGAVSDPPTAQRFLGKIRTHADRMASLVEDLLELSRLESGERPPQFEEVLPAEVAEDVVASFSSLASRKELALARVDGGAPAVVTDADRLRRILEALVENAVKYTPSGGRVEVVSAAGPDGGAILEVVDNGPGIAAEHLPRIFERFYRVDKARSRELGGTGLGLSIVRHLAQGMGAAVTVSSQPGTGTRFTVAVPTRPRISAPARRATDDTA
jgi:two-component system phosphate regulon sensor histidine kinase PhoR